jgi:hypothetical protein
VSGQPVREGLKQRVQRRELGAFDVPVRDFDLAVQVQPIGETGVQRVADLDARFLG